MAGWDDLVAFVRVRYEVMRQAEGELWFNLPTTGDRTQLVVVREVAGADGDPWAQIASPVCKVPLDEHALAGFDRSFRLVVEAADRLEEQVTGADVN